MENKIYYPDNLNNRICAILNTPENNTKSIVILGHGIDSTKNSNTNKQLDKIFLEKQIATLKFDLFARGESEGNINDSNIDRFVDDILKSIDFVKNKGYENIALYGASISGAAAVIAASKTPNLKTMVLKAPGIGQTTRKLENYKKDFENKTWINKGFEIKIPTLIIHGKKDEIIECKYSIELSKTIKNCELELFENADHRFTQKEDFDKMIKLLSGFIIEKINK